jgi:hypothetical protein
MRVTTEYRKLRFPLKSAPNMVDTGFVDAKVFTLVGVGALTAVHASLDAPGVWAVAHAPSGQLIMQLPTHEEAECFALELLKEQERGKMHLNYTYPEHMPESARHELTMFRITWAERRRLALPKYLGKVAIPGGLLGLNFQGRKT